MIIGLSGTLASGKDTVAEYLKKNEGFGHISLSAILRGILEKEGTNVNLENLTRIGNSLRKKYGGDFLVKKAKKKVDFSSNLVVSSIRQEGEVRALRKEKNFYMIFVDADPKIRFNRLIKRGRAGDTNDFKKFIGTEKKQLGGTAGGMNLNVCKKMSDFLIINNGKLEEFEKKIKDTILTIKAR